LKINYLDFQRIAMKFSHGSHHITLSVVIGSLVGHQGRRALTVWRQSSRSSGTSDAAARRPSSLRPSPAAVIGLVALFIGSALGLDGGTAGARHPAALLI
jgi:hypothetical protein